MKIIIKIIILYIIMNFDSIYIATETKFGYKLCKAKKIINLDNYNIVSSGIDEYYLEKKLEFKKINLIDIGKYDFKNCKILECVINDGLKNINTLQPLLIKIYKIINDPNLIIKNTKINVQPIENKTKGYQNIKNLNISYPKPDANLAIYEIINQCEINKLLLELKIELANKNQIKLKI